MESNVSGKFQDSIFKSYGETSIAANKLTYTWVIKNFNLACKNYNLIKDIASPVITLYNCGDKYEFQLKITIEKIYNGLLKKYHDRISSTCVTLLSPDAETKAAVRQYFVKKNGSEGASSTVREIIKNSFMYDFYVTRDHVVQECLVDGNLAVKFEITFYNATNSEPDSAVLMDAAATLSKMSILDEYEKLLGSAKFSDVTIVVGEKKFPAHKNILAARSPVFSAMFEHDMLENKENIVEITDVDAETMAEVLRFIYAGKIKDIEKSAVDLLVLADKYQIETLRIMCEGAMVKNLNTNNVADILKIVDRYETCSRLRESVMKFLRVYGREVTASKYYEKIFEELSPDFLIEVKKAIMNS